MIQDDELSLLNPSFMYSRWLEQEQSLEEGLLLELHAGPHRHPLFHRHQEDVGDPHLQGERMQSKGGYSFEFENVPVSLRHVKSYFHVLPSELILGSKNDLQMGRGGRGALFLGMN